MSQPQLSSYPPILLLVSSSPRYSSACSHPPLLDVSLCSLLDQLSSFYPPLWMFLFITNGDLRFDGHFESYKSTLPALLNDTYTSPTYLA